MARYTSLRVGGPADAVARPASAEELAALARLCAEHDQPLIALGRGFNTIAPDAGVRAVVVQLGELRALAADGHQVRAEAGVTHSGLTRFCAEQGLAGLEFAVGIPGTVGGWLAMNAGVPQREMKDVCTRVEWLDGRTGERRDVPATELRWHYRRLELPAGALVLAGRFGLEPDEPESIRERMRESMERRRATQPVNEPSCGSVFKNPPGDKAGRLIEAAGLKGAEAGGAQISTLHANFIVNRGGASTADVLELIARACNEVERRFGVTLEREVRLLGEAEGPA